MDQLLYLIRVKMVLTWRLYTRSTITSIESLIFLLVYTIWIIFAWQIVQYLYTECVIFQVPGALIFIDIFTFVLFLWLMFSIAGYRLNEGYDVNRFRTYPLPLNAIYTANIFGALLDISVLQPLAALLSVFLAAGPGFTEFLGGFLIILAFLIFMIVASQTLVMALYVLLPRLNMVKVGVAILLGILAWSLLLGVGQIGNQQPWFNFFVFFRPFGIDVFRPFPTGQAGIALWALLTHDWRVMWIHLGWFSLWLGGIIGLDYLLHLYWLENDIRIRQAGSEIKDDDIFGKILNFNGKILGRFFNPASVALYRKDMLEFSFRNPHFVIYKFLPGSIAPMIIALAMKWNLDESSGLITYPDARYLVTITMIVLVLFIVLAQGLLFSGNQFGMEDRNIRMLLAIPTPRKDVIIGKNLFYWGLFLFDSLVMSCLAIIYFPDIFIFAAVFFLMITLFTLILAIGNLISVIWPYWMPLDKASFTLRSTVILGLVNSAAMISLALLALPALAAVILPYLYGLNWLSYIFMPISVAYAILIHRLTLPSAVSIFEQNEFLILKRIADAEQL